MSKKYPLLDDYDWLYTEYIKEELSTIEIAKIVGCSHDSIAYALKKKRIAIRPRAEATRIEKAQGRTQNYPLLEDYDWLYQKYRIERMTCGELALVIGCNPKTIPLALRRLNIPVYTRSECKIGKNHTEETKQKIRDARKRQRFPTTRTVIECTYWKISKKNNIPSEYTGDGKIWIGNLNPDFIIRAKRVAIFINGDYWHSPLLNHKLNLKRTVTNQIAVCKRHRWKAVTIWGTDLEREDAEEFVLSQLKKAGII